ncbi:PIG-L family deacetylase [Patescibacteria group bacterium]|nr:PIG-L family deacetylase [Patescibacteria group bacterium]
MKKTVFCIIAHPDDEAFGPAGTLAILAKTEDVHVVCVTDGASDPRFHPIGGKTLSHIRKEELAASARALGVSKVHMLGYQDGTLNNNIYHDVADKLQQLMEKYNPSLLITTELRGISGHLDHVATAMITSYVYEKNPSIDAIWYNCTNRTVSDAMREYFVYFPPGFLREQVDMIVDISGVFTQKVAAAKCHVSQEKDAERAIKRWMQLPKEEWFLVMKRRDTFVIA